MMVGVTLSPAMALVTCVKALVVVLNEKISRVVSGLFPFRFRPDTKTIMVPSALMDAKRFSRRGAPSVEFVICVSVPAVVSNRNISVLLSALLPVRSRLE